MVQRKELDVAEQSGAIVAGRIADAAEVNNLLPANQMGNRRNRSSELAIRLLTDQHQNVMTRQRRPGREGRGRKGKGRGRCRPKKEVKPKAEPVEDVFFEDFSFGLDAEVDALEAEWDALDADGKSSTYPIPRCWVFPV
jgi:hypothetical protein